MTFAIDCDGTFTAYPEVFVAMGRALRQSGHRVYILTGNRSCTLLGDRADKWPQLRDTSWYDEAITFDKATDSERALVGVIGARPTIGEFKRRMAAALQVDVLFDDDVVNVRREGAVPVFGVA